MSRTSHEANALAGFRTLAAKRGINAFGTQGSDNRIALEPNVYYQFGDLRIEVGGRFLIVEVESAGGVTNLAKYWECYETGRITKPMKLLHLFRQKSKNDYRSHIVVWDFLATKMREALGDRFEGKWLTYTGPAELRKAMTIFELWLDEPKPV